MPKIKSQDDQRRTAVLRDQHGRKYTAVVEKETGDPVGAISPLGWSAPLLVPAKYLKVVPGEAGQIEIDYDEWIVDCNDADVRYAEQGRQYAVSMYGAQAAEALSNPPAELVQLIGPKPFPVELVLAAKSGNRWILGLTDKMPEWAKPFLKALEPADRRSRALARGADMQFPDVDDEDGEEPVLAGRTASDLDDEFDPDATGGKRVTVGKGRNRRKED